MLDYYAQSVSKALLDVFPDIGLEICTYSVARCDSLRLAAKFWTFAAKRKFFDNIASIKGFDPIKKQNWYRISQGDLLREKVAPSV